MTNEEAHLLTLWQSARDQFVHDAQDAAVARRVRRGLPLTNCPDADHDVHDAAEAAQEEFDHRWPPPCSNRPSGRSAHPERLFELY